MNKDAVQDNTMVYVKSYINSGDLTKASRELVNEGGEDVANEFVGWIQKFGDIKANDLAIT